MNAHDRHTRMHHGMAAHPKVAAKYTHSQSSEAASAVHPLTPEKFIEQQEQQSVHWVEKFTKQLNVDKALSAKFVFGRATPIENPLEREDTAIAILNKYGQ